MKFKTKIGTFQSSLMPVLLCALNGVKADYTDGDKVTLTVKGKEFTATANNGFLAVTRNVFADGSSDVTPDEDGTFTVLAGELHDTLKSYSPDATVNVAFDGKTLAFKQVGAKKEQTLQGVTEPIAMPSTVKDFDNEIVIDKTVFVNSVNSISHAIGDERFKAHLRFWKMIVEPDSMRLLVGDGSRYEIFERSGPGFLTTKNKTSLHVSRDHSFTLTKMLSQCEDPTVTIKEKKLSKSDYADQIVFELKDTTIVLMSYDPGTKWPDVYKLANRPSTVKAVTNFADWKYDQVGINVTNNDEKRKQSVFHVAEITLDKEIEVSTTGSMTAVRSIPVKDLIGSTHVRVGAENLIMAAKQHSGEVAQLELIDDKSPLIIRLYAGDKISDGPFVKVDGACKQSRTIMISHRAK